MRNRFDRQLLELNHQLIQMGSLIEKAIELAITALVKQDVQKAQEAIQFDEERNVPLISSGKHVKYTAAESCRIQQHILIQLILP